MGYNRIMPAIRDTKVNCLNCNKVFMARGYRVRAGKMMFCSRDCVALYKKGKFFGGGHPKGKESTFKGKKHTEEAKKKMSISSKGQVQPKGEKNKFWKGDEVSYRQLHKWVYTNLGKPSLCEYCGETRGRIEWANKSHKYKRDLKDWLMLCKKCHVAYDRKN